ncbi:MAG: CvpA family protein [Clostridia bacterium]|nr:CvpA family protein [Clostridia bacterium]
MGILVDVIIIALVVLSTFLAYKKGLVAQAIKLCAVIIAVIATLLFYRPVANFIINNTDIDETIQNSIYERAYDVAKQKTNNENPETDIVEGAKLAGIQHTSRELSIQIINIAVILILFFGIKIALRFVTALANAVAKLPILNKLNKVGGLIYGLIRGIVIVYACLLLISFIGKVDDTSVLHKTVEQSNIGKTMYENNILNILL